MSTQVQNDLERRLRDKDFAEEYGENIAKAEIAVTVSQARRSCNLTQEELAKKLGSSQSYIAKLEGGDANPTIGNLGRILANMGLRLMAGIGELSSRIEGKGIRNYSVNADDVIMAWVGEGITGEELYGQWLPYPSCTNFKSIQGVGVYHGAMISSPASSSVSRYGETLGVMLVASPKDEANILVRGAKK